MADYAKLNFGGLLPSGNESSHGVDMPPLCYLLGGTFYRGTYSWIRWGARKLQPSLGLRAFRGVAFSGFHRTSAASIGLLTA